ncbi:hypothetical protein [Paraburkholderia pallida]|uniref:hypothetical protein n=1 Tax=Paraburkholderia pallida TaxID=2547399 RepID=UPI00300412C6
MLLPSRDAAALNGGLLSAVAATGALHALPSHAMLAVAYYALVPTGTRHGREAAIFTAVAPVSGVVLAALVLGEPLTPARLAGLALVVAAVFVIAGPAVWRRPGGQDA